jgi:hypothetical protein
MFLSLIGDSSCEQYADNNLGGGVEHFR